MRVVGQFFGLVILFLGAVGVIAPDTLITLGRQVVTPGGIYGIAIVRIVMGFVLTMAAQKSRSPRALRGLGLLLIIAGLGTPAFGVERTVRIIGWASENTALVRVAFALPMFLGAWIMFAIRPRSESL